jgi:hypothetical protein
MQPSYCFHGATATHQCIRSYYVPRRALTRNRRSALGRVSGPHFAFRTSIRRPIHLHAGVCFAVSHSRTTLAVIVRLLAPRLEVQPSIHPTVL